MKRPPSAEGNPTAEFVEHVYSRTKPVTQRITRTPTIYNNELQETQRVARNLSEPKRNTKSVLANTAAGADAREGRGPALRKGSSRAKTASSNSRAQWVAEHKDLDFGPYIPEALNRSIEEFENGFGDSPVYWFVFYLRAHPAMDDYLSRPIEAFKLIEKSGPHDFSWFGLDRVEALAMFCDLFETIRFRPGQPPLEQARDRARADRLKLSDDLRAIRPIDDRDPRSEEDYEFFISLAGWLQVVVGNRPFQLPTRNVAELMGVSPMTVTRYRRLAVKDKFVSVTQEHSKAHRLATEFRFNTSAFDALAEKAARGTADMFEDWSDPDV